VAEWLGTEAELATQAAKWMTNGETTERQVPVAEGNLPTCFATVSSTVACSAPPSMCTPLLDTRRAIRTSAGSTWLPMHAVTEETDS